ncbi:O-antigen ligase family protein [Flavobacterium caeni]|uniref:O-Antigen ligase n=1 Tax=Flavobacterium caeni TaxID=490189 RepID=A0A1G5JBS7_9FLAO|nr:O-antigen ligase family protein [Flavobacterium caeni]SCY85410.1 O-Antigen ligase [Flavobacterium caeni]
MPIFLYALMVCSLLWTENFEDTKDGLQKEVLFFLMPFVFLGIGPLEHRQVERIFKIFSFSMMLYAVFYIQRAVFNFLATGETRFFFYHDLVSMDLSAIYMSVFASFGMFYFISREQKSKLDQTCTVVLALFIVLLSSKVLIIVNVILFVCYYIYRSKTSSSVKRFTLLTSIGFFIFSFLFIPKIQERFLHEYETAFVDNTVNMEIGDAEHMIYNLSLSQAWNDQQFESNNFLPGTALRVFQIRIFTEMLTEHDIFFTGFGFDASQERIREKVKQYNLFYGNGEFNFHNQYVQTFAEIGIFGLLILLGMICYSLKKAFTTKDFMYIVFSLTMIILFLTDSFLSRQRGIIFFLTLYCIFTTKSGIEGQRKQL